MIKLEEFEVVGWEHAARGMRNPMNSWDKGDTRWTTHGCSDDDIYIESDPEGYWELIVGPNDQKLMKQLAAAGTDHRKFMRMITVYVDITAPLYWWKEFDTYKVGTVANSCSTMHKIHEKEFTRDDFSCEHLMHNNHGLLNFRMDGSMGLLDETIKTLNIYRNLYLNQPDKEFWWQMIQLLPSSYNQKRTVMLNYEVLANIYKSRKNHKLDEWRGFCKWIEDYLPYSEIITGKEANNE